MVTGLSQPEHRGYSFITLFLRLATFLVIEHIGQGSCGLP
ncbi:MAG: hypothetical protein AVDCRST_MAG93-10024 [uncultured Chloroflexia bacterium]|uniref:Uncharacterized protein n=1 Tax=uncultured Chloroflexia bacterium TaxID=1672391 RepID=A0A6J4NT44_9CHLR|nr:MAG: hypothetical protein AVDCRST_MAG93-10024 [uncultured Chloroflexia bacterium]